METVNTVDSGGSKCRLYFLRQPIETDSYLLISSYPSSDDFLDSLKKKSVAVLTDQDVDLDQFKLIKEHIISFTKHAQEESRQSDFTLVRILFSFLFGVFMFFFAAFVIPDPIPVLDEIAIAFAGAFIFYFVINRMKLFSFSLTKKDDTFLKLIDSVQVMFSPPMECLTLLFEKYLRQFIGKEIDLEQADNILKDELRNCKLEDLSRFRLFVASMAKQYKFKRIKPGSVKFKRMVVKSKLHSDTFTFYYQLYMILFP